MAEESVYISWSGEEQKGLGEYQSPSRVRRYPYRGRRCDAARESPTGIRRHLLGGGREQPGVGSQRQGKEAPKMGKGQWQQWEASYIERG